MEFSKVKIQLIKEKIKHTENIIKNSRDIIEYINKLEDIELKTHEYCYLICLNTKNNVIDYIELSHGQYNSTFIDMKYIFQTVLLTNSCKIILLHNHISGSVEVSQADIETTKNLKQACKIMGIELLDSIIISYNEELKYDSIMKYI